MESFGSHLTFRNKLELRKNMVKVLDSKTGTKNRTESENLVSPRYSGT